MEFRHSVQEIEEMDFRILVEVDFLVNLLKGNIDIMTLLSIKKNIFKANRSLCFLEISYEK